MCTRLLRKRGRRGYAPSRLGSRKEGRKAGHRRASGSHPEKSVHNSKGKKAEASMG